MPVRFARGHQIRHRLSRATLYLGVGAAALIIGSKSLQTAVAEGDTRTLSFHHVHTGEDLTVTFKRNGRYDDDALSKLNRFMRDWRRDEQTKMEPQLFDLLWEAYREVGAKEPVHVICGYRSPQTNSMLRARSSGVAQFSLHTQGDAMDFFIPGVPLEKLRNAGLRLQRGGIGFYPTSGSPFVHMDTGSIRHWPRLSHDALVKVFPTGRTVHVPSDGKPLPGYALALADVERQGHSPSQVSLAAARNAGVIDSEERVVAEASAGPDRNLIADLLGFGGKAKEAPAKPADRPATPARAPIVVAQAVPAVEVTTERIIPMPKGRPVVLAALTPTPTPRPHLPAENVIASRANWQEIAALRLPPSRPITLASADPVVTASATPALGYAAERPQAAARPDVPIAVMKGTLPAGPETPAARADAPKLVSAHVSVRLSDPWMRAAMLTPNVTNFLTVSPMGRFDSRPLTPFVHKPTAAVVMTFAEDPHYGLETSRFTGSAVVFLATATFSPVRTAALSR